MQIKRGIRTLNPSNKYEDVLDQELRTYLYDLATMLNGALKFSDNMNCQVVTVSDTGAANTEFTVTHTLKTVPIGFIVINNNKAGIVYDSGTAWTTAAVYLKCNTANCTVKLILLAG